MYLNQGRCGYGRRHSDVLELDDEPLLRHNPVDVLKYSWHPARARSERNPCDRIAAEWRVLTTQAADGSVGRGERTAAAFGQFLILIDALFPS